MDHSGYELTFTGRNEALSGILAGLSLNLLLLSKGNQRQAEEIDLDG